jgi:hypothetical protein
MVNQMQEKQKETIPYHCLIYDQTNATQKQRADTKETIPHHPQCKAHTKSIRSLGPQRSASRETQSAV